MKALWSILLLFACASTREGKAVPIPEGGAGIGFDDLRYSKTLDRLLVPAGRAGSLVLIDPRTFRVESIGGFSKTPKYDGSHDFGVTSVDEGRSLLFVTDRTTAKVHVIDPAAKAVVASQDLAGHPDYVRYVRATDELWVTEPDSEQIEIFGLSPGAAPAPRSVATISIANGPESLVIDEARGRAYTHRWQASTIAIDLKSRAVVAVWPNGCAASRGIDIDPEHGFVFAICNEGKVTTLDPTKNGQIVSSLASGGGYDVGGFSPALRQLYVAGSVCHCLTVLRVSAQGQLSLVERAPAPSSAHCAVPDAAGNAWICDPDGGKVWRFRD